MQASWCPKIGEIPHYELQTLLSIGIRAYLIHQAASKPGIAGRRPRPPGQTPSKRERVLSRDGYVCYLCGLKIDQGEESIDHVIPKALGGHNGMGNLRAAHKVCNHRKGDMPLDEYMKLHPRLAP